MATAECERKPPNCVICQEKCIGPRILPKCGHHCCEVCILIHFSKLKDEGQPEKGFTCPSCKAVNAGRKDVKAVIGWIQSLETGNVEGNAMSDESGNNNDICSSCKSQGKSSNATKVCLECGENLCQSCSFARHSHPILRDHKVIDVQENEEVSKQFQLMCKLIFCDDHPSNYTAFYCNDHEQYGCEECIHERHNRCADIVKANAVEISEDTKIETEKIEESAKSICEFGKDLMRKKTAIVDANNKQIENIVGDLKAMLKDMNCMFDVFETNSIKRAQSIARKNSSSTNNDNNVLANMVTASTVLLQILEKLKLLAPARQNDLFLKKLKKSIIVYENTLCKMSEANKESVIELKHSVILTKFIKIGINNINELGTVAEKECSTNNDEFRSKVALSQCYIRNEKYESTLFRFNFGQPTYSFIAFLRNSDVVLADDNYGYCMRIKQNLDKSDPVKLSLGDSAIENKEDMKNIMRAAGKKDGLVAIPRCKEKKIILLSAKEELKVVGEINTLHEPKAVCVLRNGDIAVAWNNPCAFGIISVNEGLVVTECQFKQDKSGRQIKSFDFITVDEKRSTVIQPCAIDRAIYGFDFEGNAKFRYSCNGSFIPRSIALDDDGNIYVLSRPGGPNRILVLTPEGKIVQNVTPSEGWPAIPLAIAFSKSGDEFAVSQENNTANSSHVIIWFKLHF